MKAVGAAGYHEFSLVRPINVDGIGSFLGGLFRKILPYLGKGARAIGKEALRAGINVIEDVENNTPLKEAMKPDSGNRAEISKEKPKRK